MLDTNKVINTIFALVGVAWVALFVYLMVVLLPKSF